MTVLLVEAARVHRIAATAAVWQCTSRGAARQAEPCRGSWCPAGAGRHGAALGRAAQHADANGRRLARLLGLLGLPTGLAHTAFARVVRVARHRAGALRRAVLVVALEAALALGPPNADSITSKLAALAVDTAAGDAKKKKNRKKRK